MDQVFWPSFNPFDRIASTRVLPCISLILFANSLHHVRLWPRRDAVAYLPIADKYFRPLPSPLRDVNQRVMDS
jgi:hypothetical protein